MKIVGMVFLVILVLVGIEVLCGVLRILAPFICIALLKIEDIKDEGDWWLKGKDVEKWADELYEAFILEVSTEDVKQNKEALKLYKNIKRRKRNAKKAEKKFISVGR
nr:MAG TPA: cell division control protein 31 [Caudoviricetes sp.]